MGAWVQVREIKRATFLSGQFDSMNAAFSFKLACYAASLQQMRISPALNGKRSPYKGFSRSVWGRHPNDEVGSNPAETRTMKLEA
ncbi:hypothetical protein pEaSNUABM9_00072 [Erwinia phage pEa_SNUABM_9]|nr:hypothetical protein pEaSNUABM9_00072 [Erwinia phage pEa_SNUABM_9]